MASALFAKLKAGAQVASPKRKRGEFSGPRTHFMTVPQKGLGDVCGVPPNITNKQFSTMDEIDDVLTAAKSFKEGFVLEYESLPIPGKSNSSPVDTNQFESP